MSAITFPTPPQGAPGCTTTMSAGGRVAGVAVSLLARRVGMSPRSLHGKARRLKLGLVDTQGPRGAGRAVFVTPASAAVLIANADEVRELRRANKK